jgi:hypothetical protein
MTTMSKAVKPSGILMLAAIVTLGHLAKPASAAEETAAEQQARIARYDKGPATIDVSKYPARMQEYYRLFSRKCSQCHRLSRPINSDYVLPDQWSRYIKRMMYKPGSNISRSEAKNIYEFLVYDSSVRKKKELQAKLKTLSPAQSAKEEQKIKEVVDQSP